MLLGNQAMLSANLVTVGALVVATSSGTTDRSDGVRWGQQ